MDIKLVQRLFSYVAVAIIAALSICWFRRSTSSRGNSERANSKDGEAEASSSPPSVRENGFQYHVFLSFRGPDTRKTFTDLLYEALKDKGIVAFIDSEKLEKGQKMEELFGYIERSKIFVPVFSKRYGDSQWCLQEMAKIVDCKRLIVPVFFDVEPKDVRQQTGPFAPSFRRHRKNKKIDKEVVNKWIGALAEAGKISGYTLATTNGYEGKLIQVIVKRILTEVNKTSLFVAKHPVGLDCRLADLMEVLDVESQDLARIVGIHSMGGMGKTTLAKAVYNQISSRFDACSFISNIREVANQALGLISLQKQLLYDVFKDENVKISSISDGIGKIIERIRGKKVLLVLDDIDNKSQLDALAGDLDWFCSGSRIIVTTRYKHVLKAPRLKHNEVYELKQLDSTQSLQLFSWHAFGKEVPDAKFAKLSKEVASAAAGLPLALEIFGSHFFNLKTDKEWQSMLQKLKDAQDKGLHETLKISYDALDTDEKKVFLDIACFFVGQQRELPTLMWEGCGFFPDITIKVLMHKSLVSINDDTGEFEMHDHIRDMGRNIVQAESKVEKCSRLWKDDETLDVLQNKRGMENIEAIQLFCENLGAVVVDAESFAAMSQLRMLKLGEVIIEGEYEHFPRTLKWLEWRAKDLDSLPGALHLENLAILDLSGSSLTQLWNLQDFARIMVLDKLKVLNLNHCENLTVCPDFTSMLHLETLDFGYCEKIVELHPTIGCLKSLRHLSLRRCKSLKELPQEIWQSTSLTELDLTYCFQITTLPSQLGDSKSLKQQLLLGSLEILKLSGCEDFTICPDFTSMPHLEVLHLDYCYKLKKLDPSIGQLKSLTHLSLRGCTSLKKLPKEVWQLTSLEELNLCYCSKITNFPSQLPDSKLLNHPLLDKLEIPDLGVCDNVTICPDFKTMSHLEKLDFVSCPSMIELYPSIGHLKNLVHLDLSGCISLEALPLELWQLESLERLDLSVCSQIKALPSQLRNVNSLKLMLLYKLEVLNLSGCDNLTVCPNFSSTPHLDKLQFGGCKMMKELHPSIGFLKNLTYLSLKGCISMTNLPQEIWQLTSLEVLDMSDCTQIATLPPQLGYLKSLRQLFLGRTSITTMPEAMGHLKQLKYLSLQQCSSLREIHKCVCSLHNLEEVDAANCGRLASLPNSLGNLKSLRKLDLSWTAIEELPDSIASLEKLEVLTVAGCKGLKFLPASASIGSMLLKWYGVSSTNDGSLVNESSERQRFSFPEFLSSLTELDASGCYELKRIANVSNAKELQELNLTGCQKLVDVPGIEQLKQLRILKLGGCGSLYNSFRERVQEANFHNLVDFCIPGSLEESPDAQSLSFFLLKWFETGTLFLRLNACGLDSIVVEIDIRTDDEQLLFQTSVQARVWRTYDWLPRDCLTKVELGEYVKPMRNDAEKRRKMMMRVSIEGHLLLDGCYRSELYVDYDDMGYYPNNLTAANIWVNFGAPFHQYDGSVVLYLNFGSP